MTPIQPSQWVNNPLCQVSELALCGSIQDLIERTDQNSNVCLTE